VNRYATRQTAPRRANDNAPFSPLPAPGLPDRLILFDGVCALCAWWVQFVIARDPAARYRFTPVQSPFGAGLAKRFGIDPENPETNAVIRDGTAYFKSDAALRVLADLPRYGWLRLASPLPKPLRDFAYDRIANNRYRLFGRTESCLMPGPALMARFVFEDINRDKGPPGSAAY
jgi:predicted DCC family thiol-disulfide oxidoreductase YuxK